MNTGYNPCIITEGLGSWWFGRGCRRWEKIRRTSMPQPPLRAVFEGFEVEGSTQIDRFWYDWSHYFPERSRDQTLGIKSRGPLPAKLLWMSQWTARHLPGWVRKKLCRVATSQQCQASNEGRSFGSVIIKRFGTSRHAGKEGLNGFLGESRLENRTLACWDQPRLVSGF